MKKILAAVMTAALIFMLSGCGSSSSSSKISFSESTLAFGDCEIEMDSASISGDELTVKFDFLNKSSASAKKFMAVIQEVTATQDGTALEVTEDPRQDSKSNAFYDNEEGISCPIEYKFKISNDSSPIELTFLPTDFNESSQTITINLQ